MLSLEPFGGGIILELGNCIWLSGLQYVNQRVWMVLDSKNSAIFNLAMISKQFWRIQKFPNSLLAKTFKTKYFPRSSLQEYKPKSLHPWIWKNINVPQLPTLHQGR